MERFMLVSIRASVTIKGFSCVCVHIQLCFYVCIMYIYIYIVYIYNKFQQKLHTSTCTSRDAFANLSDLLSCAQHLTSTLQRKEDHLRTFGAKPVVVVCAEFQGYPNFVYGGSLGLRL